MTRAPGPYVRRLLIQMNLRGQDAGNRSGRRSVGNATWIQEYGGAIVRGKGGKAGELVLVLQD